MEKKAQLRPEWCWSRLKPQGHGPPVNCEDVGFQWPRSLPPRISRYQLPTGSCPAPTLHNHWSSPRKCQGLRWRSLVPGQPRISTGVDKEFRLLLPKKDTPSIITETNVCNGTKVLHSRIQRSYEIPFHTIPCSGTSQVAGKDAEIKVLISYPTRSYKIQIRFEPLILKLGFKTPTLQFTTWRRIPLRSDLLKSLRCNGGNPGSP